MRGGSTLTRLLAVCIFTILAAPPALSQTQDPILRIETGMHIAPILGIAIDESNRLLVTGSEDKTVRVWDISGGKKAVLYRVLRPPIDTGNDGKIYSVSISPDGSTVACGGWTGWDWEGVASVYIFDLATGALTRRLTGHTQRIDRIAHSPDGRLLVVLARESSMRIYRTSDYTLLAEDKNYGGRAMGASFNKAGTFLVTSCYDGFVRLYDLSKLARSSGISPRQISPCSKLAPPGGTQPCAVAISPDGLRVAVGFTNSQKVDVLEIEGSTLKYAYSPDTTGVEGKNDLRSVTWSSDGNFLYAGGGHRIGLVRRIRKWSDQGRGQYKDITSATNTISGLVALSAGGIAFSTYDPAIGIIDASDQRVFFLKAPIADLRANWDGFLLSPDGGAIQFSYEAFGKSPAIYSLPERSLKETSWDLFARLKAAFTLEAPKREGMEVTDWKYSSTPKLGGRPLSLKQGERSLSLAILPDRSGLVLGCDWTLRLFDSGGKQSWFVNVPASAWGVNTNGKIITAAHADGTIRWYRVSDGRQLLAFFPHNDRKRWVLWTPSGYYDASPGAEDLIGWHINNGKEQAADFFPLSRFRSARYRPDVIDQVLKTLDEKEAIRLANTEAGRKEMAEIPLREKLPPIVAITSPSDGARVSESPVKLQYSARSQAPLTGLKVLVDGRPVSVEGIGDTPKDSGILSIPIPPRDCEVSIIVENLHASGEPATVRLKWKGAAAKEEFQIKPKLYVLAIGVSQYQDPGLRLGLAAKDALDFGEVWKSQEGAMYAGTEVRLLTDAQATKGNILDGLEWIQRQVTQKDVAILFFAGHGINDSSGMFYFLPVDADLDRLKRTGISQSDITSTVAAIAGKVLVFIDACHSGNLMGKVKRRGTGDIAAVINELASAENGAVVFSSATGRQYALENPEWGNGAFTKALVEGASGKADFMGKGRITVNMLDLYVSERVKELTQGQQTPTTVKPPNVPDFPIVFVRK